MRRPTPERLAEIRKHPRSMPGPWEAIRELLAEIDALQLDLAMIRRSEKILRALYTHAEGERLALLRRNDNDE